MNIFKPIFIEQLFTYQTIELKTVAEFKDRGSRFIAYTFYVNAPVEIKNYVKEIKTLHPKAVHHCYAYKLGIDENNYRTVDDGEPAGSAGKPIFGQIQSYKITNVLIIVVRYFGGVLLGVPGLINAYKTAAQLALQENKIIEKNIEIQYQLKFNYPILNEVMRVIKQHDCPIIEQELSLFCELKIAIPLKHEIAIINKLNTIFELEITKI